MSVLKLDRAVKLFGDTTVVNGVSLEVSNGELVALLGPSGSGKTTLLRLIAGFEAADSGRVFIDGEDVTTASALQRRCAMVFQHYALFPHMSVGENVGYGLERERLPRDQQAARVAEALAMVDLAGSETRSVTSLSGGQQQRVALARALAPRPRVLLLDEPLSNLDPSLRERTRRELRELIQRIGITTVLVTHEQEEAFDLADRIAVLHQGVLEQIGEPARLYGQPATIFVAGFVGRASSLSGKVERDASGRVGVRAGGHFWPLTLATAPGTAVTLMLRPESMRLVFGGPIVGRIKNRRFAGAQTYYLIELAEGAMVEVSGAANEVPDGDEVTLELTGAGVHVFPERIT